MKKIIFFALSLISFLTVNAQIMPSITYFMDKNPYRHTLNPAFRPEDRCYVAIPAAGLISVGAGNTSLCFADVYKPIDINGEKKTVLFLDPAWENGKDQFLKALGRKNRIFAETNIQLLGFGFRTKDFGYVTVGITNRMTTNVVLPKTLLKTVFGGGNVEGGTQKWGLGDLYVGMNLFTEIGAGYEYTINDKFTVGMKAKFLWGHGCLESNLKGIDLYTSREEWKVSGDGDISVCIPGVEIIADEDGKFDEVKFFDDFDFKTLTKPAGKGFALDLGMTYRPIPELQVSAALLDLGFIKYNQGIQKISKKQDFVFDGIDYQALEDTVDYWEPYQEVLENMYVIGDDGSLTSRLSLKLMAGAEYGFWKNRITFGLLSKTTFFRSRVYEDLSLSFNFKPCRTASFSVSYSFLDGRWSNLGFGLNLNLGPLNFFVLADQIPLKFGKGPFPIPIKTQYVNVATGLNIAIWPKRVKNRDKKVKETETKIEKIEEVKDTVVAVVETQPVVVPEEKVEVVVPVVVDTPVVVEKVEPQSESQVVETKVEETKVEPVPEVVQEPVKKVKEDTIVAVALFDGPARYDTIVKVDENGNRTVYINVKPNKDEGELIREALYGIQFSNNNGIIKMMVQSKPILDRLVARMKADPGSKVFIRSHYFKAINPSYNRSISRDYAKIVRGYLFENGIEYSRITYDDLGSDEPICETKTPEGKKRNTRMEIRFFKGK